MTAYTIDPDAWVLVHTAGADGAITIQNQNSSRAMRVRIGAAVVIGDALTDPCHLIMPMERARFEDVKSGDKVLVAINKLEAVDAAKMRLVVWA